MKATPAQLDTPPRTALLDRVLLYLLVAGLAVRPLISETYERLNVSFLEALQTHSGPTPASTVCLDAFLLLTALLVLVRHDCWRARPTLLAAVVLLALAAGLSTWAASDKHVAFIAASGLLAMVLAALALGALTRVLWMRRLVLAVLVASGVTVAVKCAAQLVIENPLTRTQWTQVYKPQLIAQGVDTTDPLFVNYERRMNAGEVYGFLGHPNLTASCLTMWLLVSGGVLLALRSPLSRVVAALVCVLIGAALPMTGSRGALAGAVIGIAALAVLGALVPRLRVRTPVLLAALLTAYLLVIALAAAYGRVRGTLPTASLAFRWNYWSAAQQALAESPWTGLGRGNFAAAHLRHKSPETTEEVRDPHNIWLTLLVELGPAGLLGGALLTALALRAALSGLEPVEHAAAVQPDVLTIARAAPLVPLFLLCHALFSRTPFGEPGALLVWGQELALVWILAFLVAIWLLSKLQDEPRGARWVAAGCCAALIAVLVHSLIDFALVTPAGLAVFILCALAARPPSCPVPPPGLRPGTGPASPMSKPEIVIRAVAGLALLAAYFRLGVWPAYQADVAADRIRASLNQPLDRVRPALCETFAFVAASTSDSGSALAAARAALQFARAPALDEAQRLDWLGRAAAMAATANARNPRDVNIYSTRGLIADQQGSSCLQLDRPEDARRARHEAVDHWQQAVALYPTDPRLRIAVARACIAVWTHDGNGQMAHLARTHLSEAMRIDEARPPHDTVRLRPSEREQVTSMLRQLDHVTSAPNEG